MADEAFATEAFATEARQVADSIEEHANDVLAAYKAELHAARNLLDRNPAMLDQTLTHALQIITDVANCLRIGSFQVSPSHKRISRSIGSSRAASGVNTQESLVAASLFHEAALSIWAPLLTQSTQPLRLFCLVAVTLERSISLRVREAVSSYTGFLLDKIHDVQLDERRHTARDLHDRIGNSMSVAHQNIELFQIFRESDPLRASIKLDFAEQALQEAMQNLRAVTSDLHSRNSFNNLEKALSHYLETMQRDDFDIHLKVSGDERWAPSNVLDEVFLITREASHNSLRHAFASILFINITITPHELHASIEDDGRGFEPSREPESTGVGISSMRARSRLLGGTMLISSRIGQGTLVEFLIPLGKTAPIS
ncbi:sensor histidine kinase [Streptomyces phaeolivaceus]|uniref:sensor histidine kinase n=1 Tax=Streptomyces phaeolivaceus TaxID=2653200 RepID=UPI00186A3CCC|nr:histidine kinase [Streptomyces phaeolivaceus]